MVVADGLLYYGSSADDTLRCLDATSGRPVWEILGGRTDPVGTHREPRIGSLGCDDGAVYCLDAKLGTLRWTARPPSARDERLPGNGRVMSLWPVRTGVLVRGETAYFGAGLFPAEGTWQCTVEVRSGRILDEKPVDLSPQGYLKERDGQVIASTGRLPREERSRPSPSTGCRRRAPERPSRSRAIPTPRSRPVRSFLPAEIGRWQPSIKTAERRGGKPGWIVRPADWRWRPDSSS